MGQIIPLSAKFLTCDAFTASSEGSYVDNPEDHGGPTNMGITIATLSAWLKRPATIEDVKNLAPEVAQQIREAGYWVPIQGDLLPPGVDVMVYDMAVNSGVSRSAKLLQGCVGAGDDGDIGPKTLALVNAMDIPTLINRLAEAQEAFYVSLADYPIFGHGWLTRLAQRQGLALKMAGTGQ